jgi:hypothetical protein
MKKIFLLLFVQAIATAQARASDGLVQFTADGSKELVYMTISGEAAAELYGVLSRAGMPTDYRTSTVPDGERPPQVLEYSGEDISCYKYFQPTAEQTPFECRAQLVRDSIDASRTSAHFRYLKFSTEIGDTEELVAGPISVSTSVFDGIEVSSLQLPWSVASAVFNFLTKEWDVKAEQLQTAEPTFVIELDGISCLIRPNIEQGTCDNILEQRTWLELQSSPPVFRTAIGALRGVRYERPPHPHRQ